MTQINLTFVKAFQQDYLCRLKKIMDQGWNLAVLQQWHLSMWRLDLWDLCLFLLSLKKSCNSLSKFSDILFWVNLKIADWRDKFIFQKKKKNISLNINRSRTFLQIREMILGESCSMFVWYLLWIGAMLPFFHSDGKHVYQHIV